GKTYATHTAARQTIRRSNHLRASFSKVKMCACPTSSISGKGIRRSATAIGRSLAAHDRHNVQFVQTVPAVQVVQVGSNDLNVLNGSDDLNVSLNEGSYQ